MPGLALMLDDDGCPTDQSARTCLRALAQRGARLVAAAHGAAVRAERKGQATEVAWLAANMVAALDAAGWLTEIDPGVFILAPSGRAIVRALKASPAPSAGMGGVPPPLAIAHPAPAARDSPLAWARQHRNKDGNPYLSQEAYTAGERLREDFHRAGMMPRTTLDWDAIPRSKDEQSGARAGLRTTSDSTSAAAERVRKAVASVPPEFAGLLYDVCCFGHGVEETGRRHGMPQRSGHFILAIALNALARHYGLLPQPDATWSYPSRARHWGTPDYKPVISDDVGAPG